MATTHGHGNPDWTHDEVILALDLYFDCGGRPLNSSDPRVQELSNLLRELPHHNAAARKASFRNPDGVAFKLQNLRQIATGKGLSNVSRIDREVWDNFGHLPEQAKQRAKLIRAQITLAQETDEDLNDDDIFTEGKLVTRVHFRRERNPKLRKRLLEQRRRLGKLRCDICECVALDHASSLSEAIFEAHHVLPLAAAAERKTKLKDMALLCANCHRMVHRAIAKDGRWLDLEEVSAKIRREISPAPIP